MTNKHKVIQEFYKDREDIYNTYSTDKTFSALSREFFYESIKHKYSYCFDWYNRPIIQYPQDVMAVQEIVMKVKPDIIIETGIAHGGSVVYNASLLSLLDIEDRIVPWESDRKVIAVDIDIREHNRDMLENHPLAHKMTLLEGSSIDSAIVDQIKSMITSEQTVMVMLDSNHTHQHVLDELNLYSSFVSTDSYLIVFDTCIEHLPKGHFTDRDWDVGNSPMTALHEWLESNHSFEIDETFDKKLMLSVAPNGYLKRKN